MFDVKILVIVVPKIL